MIFKMCDYLKPVSGGRFAIQYFEVSDEDVKRCRLRDSINGTEEYECFKPGTYVRLKDTTIKNNNGVVMSDTYMEWVTNFEFIYRAKGKVLIAGLGLGMIVLAIQDNKDVSEIIVVEKYKEIIDLVTKQLKFNDKVKIENEDIFDYIPNRQFDTIYFDIWNNISSDNFPDMVKLHERYKKYLVKEGWLNSWRYDDCFDPCYLEHDIYNAFDEIKEVEE